MKFIPQAIPEILVIQTKEISDGRGYFSETYRQDKLSDALGLDINFVQDNQSKSTMGVLRGLHFQISPFAQSKLVRVIDGEVLDVAVDIRKGSPTFGKHVSAILSDENKKQMFIPRGFAHGYIVLSNTATFSYKVDNLYSPKHERGLAFDDPQVNINWSIPAEQFFLSEKDRNQPSLSCLEDYFNYKYNYYE